MLRIGLLLTTLLAPGALAAGPPVRNAVRQCTPCHDATLESTAVSAPKLEGLSSSYLTRQIQAYTRSQRGVSVNGNRCSISVLMSLRPADYIEILHHYSNAVPAPEPLTPATPETLEIGRTLFLEGRLGAGIQACATCHGADATGGTMAGLDPAAVAPRLAGQREAYLLSQLRSFRKGARLNDFNGIMERMVADLSETDFAAVSAWLATLDPATLPPKAEQPTMEMPAKAAFCQACHGVGGQSMQETFPKIGGLSKDHVLKQLRDIQSGARTVDVMTPIVYGLSDAEMKEIGLYFSQFEMARGPYDPLKARRGETIFHTGNTTTGGYPACMHCHGADGRGISGVEWAPGDIPALAGQHPGYLKRQLYAFKAGTRDNDHGSMMRLVAIRMTDQEIDDVTQYLYSLGTKGTAEGASP